VETKREGKSDMSKLEKAFTVLTLMGSWITAARAYSAGETALVAVCLVLSLVEYQWWRHRKLEEDHKELKESLKGLAKSHNRTAGALMSLLNILMPDVVEKYSSVEKESSETTH
jgi:hypothetical protein